MSLKSTLKKMVEELKDAAMASYNRVYPQDGLIEHERYITDPLNKFAAFVGIPHRKTFERDKQTVKQLGYDFLGLQEGVSPAKKWVNRGLLPFVALFNFVNMFFQTALNIVKFFTEFLPLTLAEFIAKQAYNIILKVESDQSSKSQPSFDGRMLLVYLLIALSFVMSVLYFIGRSITSPIEGVKMAWNLGRFAPKSQPWARELLGAFFATLSVLFTVTAYVILFPLLVKVAASVLANLGVNLAGTFIPQVIAWLKPVFAPIGSVFAQVASYLSLSAILNASVAFEIGVAAVAAVGITIIGTPISKLLDQFKEWWQKLAPTSPIADSERLEEATGLGYSPELLKIFYYQDESLPVDLNKERHKVDSEKYYLHVDPELETRIAYKESKPLPFTLFGAVREKESLPLYEPYEPAGGRFDRY